jgi:hypothetical protein
MSALLRKALFWLLVLALPMQTSMAVGAMSLAPGAATHAEMHAMQVRDASGPTAMPGVQASAQRDCANLPDCAALHHAGGKCALAAPCALVAAPMQQAVLFLPTAPRSIPPDATVQRRVSFFTGGPERPPRNLA